MAGDLDVFEPIVPISLLIGLAFGITSDVPRLRPELLFDVAGARIVRRLHRPRPDDGPRGVLRTARWLLLRRDTRRPLAAPQPLRSKTHVAPQAHAGGKLLTLMASRSRRWGSGSGPGRIRRGHREQRDRGHQRQPSSSGFSRRSPSTPRARSRCTSPQATTGAGSVRAVGWGFCRWRRCNRWYSAERRRSCSPCTQ